MQPFTQERPKCMLEFGGRSLIAYTVDGLRQAGCDEITIVTGHLADQIRVPGCRTVLNTDYENNNILHSLMYAKDSLAGDVCITYSDILVNPGVYKDLAACSGDIVIVADRDWQPYYDGRTYHLPSEAEKAFIEVERHREGRVRRMGKHLDPLQANSYLCAEFLGLWKMSAMGARAFRAHFESLDRRLTPTSPFQAAKEWQKAYITDFLTDLIASGITVNCLVIERGWAEIDTVQDYERLPDIAARQRLALGGSQET